MLVAERAEGAQFEIAIFDSSDNREWRRRVSLTADAMGRSAELMDGYFYVGLGCELRSCTRSAGRLMRVAATP